jgi:hypothetical protein
MPGYDHRPFLPSRLDVAAYSQSVTGANFLSAMFGFSSLLRMVWSCSWRQQEITVLWHLTRKTYARR